MSARLTREQRLARTWAYVIALLLVVAFCVGLVIPSFWWRVFL